MSQTVSRPEKTEDGFTIIYDVNDIPAFDSEAEESAYWDTHTVAEHLLGRDQAELDRLVPARARANTKRPVSIRFDDDTLTRLKKLAGVKKTNYQTLVKNFVNERLYEEEKREGVL